MTDKLYIFEVHRDQVCSICEYYECDECPVEKEYRKLLDEEFGKDFPTPMTIHAIDSDCFTTNPEKWLARRHRKGDVRAKAKARKVIVRQKDTGHLKDNRSTTRRKAALESKE